jgi:dTDP-glucose pyrophosphorylase
MKNSVNIVILAGRAKSSADYPLWLAEVNGTPIIELLLAEAKALNPRSITVVMPETEARTFHAQDIVSLLSDKATVRGLKGQTAGAAASALLMAGEVDNEDELLLLSANEYLDVNLSERVQAMRTLGWDAGTLVFKSVHPRYSFVRLAGDLVTEASEKRPISTNATAGLYWFKQGKDFVEGAKSMIIKDAHVNGNFYVCPVFNELILKQKKVGALQIDSSAYHPLKNEQQIEQEATQRCS